MTPATAALPRSAASNYFALLLLGCLWGGSFSAAKLATFDNPHPVSISFWQGIIGALILSVMLFKQKRKPIFDRAHLTYYSTTAIIGIIIPNLAFYTAASRVPAGVLSMLVPTASMLTYGFAVLAAMEAFSWRRVSGIALGFSGVAVLLGPAAALPEPEMLHWALIAMIAPLCYSCNTMFIARFRPKDGNDVGLAFGMLLFAAVMQGLYVIPSGNLYSILPPWSIGHAGLLTLGIIAGVAYMLCFNIIDQAGPVFFSQVGFIVPVAGVLWSMWLLGESHSNGIWISLALLLAGISMVRPRGL